MDKKPTYEELEQKIRMLESAGSEAKERMLMGKNSKQSDEPFWIFMEMAGDFMFICDKTGVLSYVNSALTLGVGYSKQELTGMNLSKLVKENVLEKNLKKRLRDLLNKGKISVETVWIKKDGTEIYGNLKVFALFDKSGDPVEYRGVLCDVSKYRSTEQALKEREAELELKNRSLEEMNVSLHVLLKEGEKKKKEVEKKVTINVQKLVLPYLDKLKNSPLKEEQRAYVEVVESNLENIISPFVHGLSCRLLNLTSREIIIADHIRQGRTTKEIAGLLSISAMTVESHRKNIRRKIGIKNQKDNLRTYLMNLH